MKGMHDNPALFPTLPGREMSATDREVMVEPNRGTQWERCWEYVLTHDLTEAEGSAFETRGSNTLPATGHCHTCDRRVSGERRFCGRCSARRSR